MLQYQNEVTKYEKRPDVTFFVEFCPEIFDSLYTLLANLVNTVAIW